MPVTSGVPQESVLGSLMFLLFVNDITDYFTNSRPISIIKLFADDIKMYMEINTSSDVDVLQSGVDCIAVWASKWQLKLASAKCQFFSCRSSQVQSGQIHVEWFWLTRNYCNYWPWRQNVFMFTIFGSYRLYFLEGQVKSQSNTAVFCQQRCWYFNKSFCNVCPTVARVLLPSLVSLQYYSY